MMRIPSTSTAMQVESADFLALARERSAIEIELMIESLELHIAALEAQHDTLHAQREVLTTSMGELERRMDHLLNVVDMLDSELERRNPEPDQALAWCVRAPDLSPVVIYAAALHLLSDQQHLAPVTPASERQIDAAIIREVLALTDAFVAMSDSYVSYWSKRSRAEDWIEQIYRLTGVPCELTQALASQREEQ
jgi:hypothetical protein